MMSNYDNLFSVFIRGIIWTRQLSNLFSFIIIIIVIIIILFCFFKSLLNLLGLIEFGTVSFYDGFEPKI